MLFLIYYTLFSNTSSLILKSLFRSPVFVVLSSFLIQDRSPLQLPLQSIAQTSNRTQTTTRETPSITHSLSNPRKYDSIRAETTTNVPERSSEPYKNTTVTTALILPPILHGSASVDLRGSPSQMIRSLPSLNSMSPSLEDRAPSPLPPLGHDISRPSSTSTQSSSVLRQQQHHHQQREVNNVSLPGLATLASVASAPSPQMRCVVLFLTNEGLISVERKAELDRGP